MKRKRSSRVAQCSSKRQKIDSDPRPEEIGHPVLVGYYPQVVSLKRWLQKQAPNLSERRKKILSDPVRATSQVHRTWQDEVARLLSDVLVGVTPGKTSTTDYEADLKHFSQRASTASGSSAGSARSSAISTMNEVCFLVRTRELCRNCTATCVTRYLIMDPGRGFRDLEAVQ